LSTCRADEERAGLSPPDELTLFCGMSIGYEDVMADHTRTGRAPLAETVMFVEG